MNKSKFFRMAFLLVISMVLTYCVAHAEVSIRIATTPSSTLVYSPVYVTAEIKNTGNNPILIPISQNSKRGSFLEISTGNEHLSNLLSTEGTNLYDEVVLLKPGDKHLVLYEIWDQLKTAGVYEIRAGVLSDGRCRIAPSSPLALIPLEDDSGSVPLFKCWAGTIASQTIQLQVSEPVVADDRAALGYILNGKFSKIGKTVLEFSHSYPYLKKRYPSSYYTYVAAFYRAAIFGGGDPVSILEEAIRLQPNHPLDDLAKTLLAIMIISESRRPTRDHVEELREILPSEMQLPDSLRKYIIQFKREKEKEQVSGAKKVENF